jgi:hypothetical protein
MSDEPEIWKIDVVGRDTPEPVELAEGIEFDPGDPLHPIMISYDGWISLADAEDLYDHLGKAIALARAIPGKS